MRIHQVVVRAQRSDRRHLQRFLADPRMHEAARLSALDELGDALFESAAQDHLAVDVESKLRIHRRSFSRAV